jgi:hypothetical protein
MQNLGRLSILYENSDKTAAEVCEIVGVGRKRFFVHIVAKRNELGKTKISRSLWLDNVESACSQKSLPRFCMLSSYPLRPRIKLKTIVVHVEEFIRIIK